MRLTDLVGQEQAAQLLGRAIAAKRVAHAYLFEGPAGVGKRSAAIGLGLALACPDQGCGTCDICRRVLAGNHPDVRVVVPTTTQILLDQAQELVLLAGTRPHEARARVIVLDEADRLNPNAGNCLLKTLEEPFPGNHFVLVTAAPDRLLPTIRSRTQRVRFVPVRPALLIELATRRGQATSADTVEAAAALAGGSVARFWQLVQAQSEATLWPAVETLRRAAARKDMGPVFEAAMELADKETKDALPSVLALLGRFYRDALAAAAGAPELMLLREHDEDLRRLAKAGERDPHLVDLRRALGAVIEAEIALAGNVNAVSVLEHMLLELRPCERSVMA